MPESEAQQRLRQAKTRLLETLSGQKQNAADVDVGGTIIEYRDFSEIIKLNASKSALRSTLSGGRYKEPAAPNVATETAQWRTEETGRVIVSDVPAGAVQKLNEAKAELKKTLAQAITEARAQDDLVKTMQKGCGGIRNATEDSGRANLQPGQGVYSGGWQITGRGGRVTLDTIRQEEQEQRDHSVRHMCAMYTPIPTPAERDDAILKTMKKVNN